MNILKENPGIMDSNEKVTWDRWEWGPNERLNSHRLDQKTKTTSKKELIEMYLSDLHAMSYHLFSCNWNYSQFLNIKENLKEGQLLQVLDFGQNYINVYQDEPQGSHWDHTQTVIHPIVNYYIKDGKLVDRRAHYDH